MEALIRAVRATSLVCLLAAMSFGASHRTQNFIVSAKSKKLAVEIANAAERYRAELAVEWLGKELAPWADPCPIQANVSDRLGAGGATSFLFSTNETQHYNRPVRGDGLFRARPVGHAYGWEMTLHGSRERVLDSVLPHEVTHTIFATHFGRPLPRWADEGACTTVEHDSEKAKQHRLLYEFLTDGKGIAFNRMFSMKDYPAEMLPLYSQGYSLTRYLIAQGGRRKFVAYVGEGLNTDNWTQATYNHYGFKNLSELQVTWLEWVRVGCPPLPMEIDSLPNDPAKASPELLARQGRPHVAPNHSDGVRPLEFRPASPARNTAPRESLALNTVAEQSGQSWYASRSQQAKAAGANLIPPPWRNKQVALTSQREPNSNPIVSNPANTNPVNSAATSPAGSFAQISWNTSDRVHLSTANWNEVSNTAQVSPQSPMQTSPVQAADTTVPGRFSEHAPRQFAGLTQVADQNRGSVQVADQQQHVARLQPSKQREVMMEWGKPSPFLRPALAARPDDTVGRR